MFNLLEKVYQYYIVNKCDRHTKNKKILMKKDILRLLLLLFKIIYLIVKFLN